MKRGRKGKWERKSFTGNPHSFWDHFFFLLPMGIKRETASLISSRYIWPEDLSLSSRTKLEECKMTKVDTDKKLKIFLRNKFWDGEAVRKKYFEVKQNMEWKLESQTLIIRERWSLNFCTMW